MHERRWVWVAIAAAVGCGGVDHWLGSGNGGDTVLDAGVVVGVISGDAGRAGACSLRGTSCGQACDRPGEVCEAQGGEALCTDGFWICRAPGSCFLADGYHLACNLSCAGDCEGCGCANYALNQFATCTNGVYICGHINDASTPVAPLDAGVPPLPIDAAGPTCFDPSGEIACGAYCRPDEEGQSCGTRASGDRATCITGSWVCSAPLDAAPTPELDATRSLDCFYTNGVLACNTSCRPDEEGSRCIDRGVLATCGAGIWICDALPQPDAKP